MKFFIEFHNLCLGKNSDGVSKLEHIKNAEAFLGEVGYKIEKITDVDRDCRIWVIKSENTGTPIGVYGIMDSSDLLKAMTMKNNTENNENDEKKLEANSIMDVFNLISDKLSNEYNLIEGPPSDEEYVGKEEILETIEKSKEMEDPVNRLYFISQLLLDYICDDDFDECVHNAIDDIIDEE